MAFFYFSMIFPAWNFVRSSTISSMIDVDILPQIFPQFSMIFPAWNFTRVSTISSMINGAFLNWVHIASKSEFLDTEKVLTSKDSLSQFTQLFPSAKVIHEGNQFSVSLLTLPFLNPATREKETPRYIIIDLDGKP